MHKATVSYEDENEGMGSPGVTIIIASVHQ